MVEFVFDHKFSMISDFDVDGFRILCQEFGDMYVIHFVGVDQNDGGSRNGDTGDWEYPEGHNWTDGFGDSKPFPNCFDF